MKEVAFANALAIVSDAVSLVCALLVWTARDFVLGIASGWVHGMDLAALPVATPTLSGVLVGLVTLTVAAWAVGYSFAWTYNRLAK
ncbi:MAG: hypothetical protein HYY87_00180 [Candidatus Levybacteria bacterium]|nr:hypothetical protein [Candidatus Levybacteria bacterium]